MKRIFFWAILAGSAFGNFMEARSLARQVDNADFFILKLNSKVVSCSPSNNALRSLHYDDVAGYALRSVLVTNGVWFAVCSTNGHWSLQSRGGVLVSGRWEWISAPDSGHAIVRDAKGYGILSLMAGSTRYISGSELRDIRFGAISAKEGKTRWNYYDVQGNPILEPGATFVEPASDGFGAAQFESGASAYWKVYKISDGVEVFAGRKFEDVSKVCDGIFLPVKVIRYIYSI
jgi:hypothetical protein